MSAKEDRKRADTLVSEIHDIVDNRAAERQSIVQITARLAELIVILNRQSSRIQWWMTVLAVFIALLTFVLVIQTCTLIIKTPP